MTLSVVCSTVPNLEWSTFTFVVPLSTPHHCNPSQSLSWITRLSLSYSLVIILILQLPSYHTHTHTQSLSPSSHHSPSSITLAILTIILSLTLLDHSQFSPSSHHLLLLIILTILPSLTFLNHSHSHHPTITHFPQSLSFSPSSHHLLTPFSHHSPSSYQCTYPPFPRPPPSFFPLHLLSLSFSPTAGTVLAEDPGGQMWPF